MLYTIVVVCAVLLLPALYLIALCPNRGRQARMAPFRRVYIAHRGLFNNTDTPENSLPAFAKAVRAGYGIELDVQLTADDRLVVFHDETLKRMCGDDRALHRLTYDELCALSLLNTGEKIPLFRDVLDLIGGAVPLIVEVKSEGRYLRTSELTAQMLDGYEGAFCVESFHPMVLRWFRRHRPGVIRGQLSMDRARGGRQRPWLTCVLLNNLLYDFLAKPDFIAYDHHHKDQFSFRLCRKLFHPVCVAWTIRSQEELEEARDVFEVMIFDSFIPR